MLHTALGKGVAARAARRAQMPLWPWPSRRPCGFGGVGRGPGRPAPRPGRVEKARITAARIWLL
eukprot:6182885-Pleurochrysis_carterae.AAC.2